MAASDSMPSVPYVRENRACRFLESVRTEDSILPERRIAVGRLVAVHVHREACDEPHLGPAPTRRYTEKRHDGRDG
jgi:hypothetical protein